MRPAQIRIPKSEIRKKPEELRASRYRGLDTANNSPDMTRSLPKLRTNRQLKQYQGFTAIELLVVIGILTVLAGIIFVAVSRVGRSAKENLTRATLANLQGMLADLEASGGARKQPELWLWTNGTAITRVNPVPGSANYPGFEVDFWKLPYRVGGTSAGTFDALASPADVRVDGVGSAVNQRNGSIAIVNTALAMSIISKLSDNRTRLQALPQNQLFIPEWSSGTIQMPGADLFVGFGTDSSTALQYAPGVHLKYGQNQFVATSSYPTGNPPPAPNATSGAWIDESKAQNPAPLLVDGWNNPIIFVPATGLRVRLLNGQKTFDSADATQNYIVISPEGEVANNNSATAAVLRAGRPFFASAGPDGDFTSGDDNIYSFEK